MTKMPINLIGIRGESELKAIEKLFYMLFQILFLGYQSF